MSLVLGYPRWKFRVNLAHEGSGGDQSYNLIKQSIIRFRRRCSSKACCTQLKVLEPQGHLSGCLMTCLFLLTTTLLYWISEICVWICSLSFSGEGALQDLLRGRNMCGSSSMSAPDPLQVNMCLNCTVVCTFCFLILELQLCIGPAQRGARSAQYVASPSRSGCLYMMFKALPDQKYIIIQNSSGNCVHRLMYKKIELLECFNPIWHGGKYI